MRFLALFLAVAVSACASHKQPSPPFIPIVPPTADHCQSAIQVAQDKMNAVDFNRDRKGEVKRYIAKARAAQAKGDFGKCIELADKAVTAS